MSTTQVKQAEDVLAAKVYEPVFLEKCAELGVTFPDRETFDAALEATVRIKETLNAQQGSTVKSAVASLRKMAGVPSEQDQKVAAAKKQAQALTAKTVGQDPEVLAALAALRK